MRQLAKSRQAVKHSASTPRNHSLEEGWSRSKIEKEEAVRKLSERTVKPGDIETDVAVKNTTILRWKGVESVEEALDGMPERAQQRGELGAIDVGGSEVQARQLGNVWC